MSHKNNFSQNQLPQPSVDAIEQSALLTKLIIDEINKNNGKITFAEYMRLTLYAPGLGYYSAGSQKFGKSGDFITAPEISPLFGLSLAKQCQEIFLTIDDRTLFELGAGSGQLAVTLLLELERLSCLPDHYFILEVSADLRSRQKQTLLTKCPHLISRIHWLDNWPTDPFTGIVIANEVLDAMPIHRFYLDTNGIKEYYVAYQNDSFTWSLQLPSSNELTSAIQKIQRDYLPHSVNYSSEINLVIPSWIKQLSQCITKGVILLIDYGYPKAEYYLDDRNNGTLMCFYRHRAHHDPFLWPGLQDITSHVDFTLVAEAALEADLSVIGYNSQAGFLLGCGIINYFQQLHEVADELDKFNLQQQFKQLTLPSEMGEIIKVIALARDINISLCGFNLQDRKHRL